MLTPIRRRSAVLLAASILAALSPGRQARADWITPESDPHLLPLTAPVAQGTVVSPGGEVMYRYLEQGVVFFTPAALGQVNGTLAWLPVGSSFSSPPYSDSRLNFLPNLDAALTVQPFSVAAHGDTTTDSVSIEFVGVPANQGGLVAVDSQANLLGLARQSSGVGPHGGTVTTYAHPGIALVGIFHFLPSSNTSPAQPWGVAAIKFGSGGPPVSGVPEPASLALAALGALGLVGGAAPRGLRERRPADRRIPVRHALVGNRVRGGFRRMLGPVTGFSSLYRSRPLFAHSWPITATSVFLFASAAMAEGPFADPNLVPLHTFQFSPSAPMKTEGPLLQQARDAMRQGDSDRAINCLTQAIQADPSNVQAYFLRGEVFEDRKEFDRALRDLNEALRIAPNDPVAYDKRGIGFARKGEYRKAIADFDQALRLDPGAARAHGNRAAAYIALGEVRKAITDLDEAIRLSPKETRGYVNRGGAYLSLREYDRAIADCTQAIRLSPKEILAYVNRSGAYLNLRKYDRAIADCTQAIRLNPKETSGYVNRSAAYLSLREYDRAIADCTEIIRLSPKEAPAYLNRGSAYIDLGEYDRAIADLTQALLLDPRYRVDCLKNRALAYVGNDDYNRALADLAEAVRLDPKNAGLAQEWQRVKKLKYDADHPILIGR